jgi:Carbohydrate binding domain
MFFTRRPEPVTLITSLDHMGRPLIEQADYGQPIVPDSAAEERALRALQTPELEERGGERQYNELRNSSAEIEGYPFFWAAGPPTLQNLVPNPGFEINATGWSIEATAGFTSPTFARSTAWSPRGVASGLLTATNPTASARLLGAKTDNIPVNPSANYVASAYFKFNDAPNAGARVEIYWFTAASAFISASVGSTSAVTNGQKIRLSVTGTAPSNAAFARVVVFGASSAAGDTISFAFDDVMLTEGNVLVPYFDGDFAGFGWTGTPHASASSNMAPLVNLIANPSFETNTTGWSTGNNFLINSAASLTRVAAPAATHGGYALQVNTNTSFAFEGVQHSIAVTGGVTYKYTAQVYFPVGVSYRIAMGDATGWTEKTGVGSGDWQQISLTHTPSGSGTTNISVSTGGAPVAISFTIDAVTVTASAPSGIFTGDDPGASWDGTAHASTSRRTAVGSPNLIPNPKAALGVSQWGLYQNPGGSGVTLGRATGVGPAGTSSWFMINPGSGTTNVGINAATADRQEFIKVRPGQQYTLSAYGKRELAGSTNFRCHVHWFDEDENIIGGGNTGSLVSANANGWTRASVTATAPANAVTASPYVWFDSPYGSGHLYVGAIMFNEGPVPFGYFDGDHEGCWWIGAANASPSLIPPLVRSADWSASGEASFRWTAHIQYQNFYPSASQNVPVIAGRTYFIRSAYRVNAMSGPDATLFVHWFNSGGGLISYESVGSYLQGSPEGVAQGSVVAPVGATSMTFVWATNGGQGNIDMNFDAVLVAEVPAGTPVPPYFDGSTGAPCVTEFEGAEHQSRSYRLV